MARLGESGVAAADSGGVDSGVPVPRDVQRKHAMFYRCAARTLVPGSRAALGYPRAAYLREDHLLMA